MTTVVKVVHAAGVDTRVHDEEDLTWTIVERASWSPLNELGSKWPSGT